MDRLLPLVVVTLASVMPASFRPIDQAAPPPAAETGSSDAAPWTPLFDGASLAGWKGDSQFWRVEDGCIVGRSTAEHPCQRTTYLHFVGKEGDAKAGVFGDFEIEFDIKLEGAAANSGLQYRSTPKGPKEGDGFDLSGYQADIDAAHAYSGILYETYGRGIAVNRGEAVRLQRDGTKQAIEPARPDAELKAILEKVDRDPNAKGWHHYRVMAKGRHLEHWIDGSRFMLAEDEGAQFAAEGIFALQIHQGDPMTVRVRDIKVRPLK